MMNIPTPKQRFIIPDLPNTDDLIPYLRQIDENRWYSNFGPLAHQFEQDFITTMRDAHEDEHDYGCAGMASGYYALNVGLRLLGIDQNSTVLVPTVTFPACGLVVENIGAKILYADVDPVSWTLTPEIARNAIKHNKIDAVMPVCIYGMAVPVDEWDLFTEETGVKVIIDAAAAIETQHYLNHGIVAHSMHALKPFGIGEGGILITPNKEMAAIAHQSINFGMQQRSTLMRGENAKMSEYHAAVGLAQMKRWPEIKKRRKDVTNMYLSALKNEPRATAHPKLKESIVSCLMISLNSPVAETTFDALIEHDIPAHKTYLPPLHKHPHFEQTEVISQNGKIASPEAMSGSKWMEDHVLGLPFHSFMEETEVQSYVSALTQILDHLETKVRSCA